MLRRLARPGSVWAYRRRDTLPDIPSAINATNHPLSTPVRRSMGNSTSPSNHRRISAYFQHLISLTIVSIEEIDVDGQQRNWTCWRVIRWAAQLPPARWCSISCVRLRNSVGNGGSGGGGRDMSLAGTDGIAGKAVASISQTILISSAASRDRLLLPACVNTNHSCLASA